jgi:hypothetical protein
MEPPVPPQETKKRPDQPKKIANPQRISLMGKTFEF